MIRSFRRGFWMGLIGSVAFLAAVVSWVYRCTGKIPFPVRRPAEGELTIALVTPDEARGHWERWKEELRPVLDELRALGDEVIASCRGGYTS